MFNILLIEYRAGGTAAISTGQTISFFKYLIVDILKLFVQVAWVVSFEFVKKFSVAYLLKLTSLKNGFG
jgi:hypothetical protein